jgi:methylenetetrahydrofolate--tRNA-(uracil-5-)-methyltransferase
VVGGGLAGCEAAFQLAERGRQVTLFEQRPHQSGPAHDSAQLAELVCSNSFRGAALQNAVGLLKEELRRAGSLLMTIAEQCRVPAGGALAVDRSAFSKLVTERIEQHPRIRVLREPRQTIPAHRPCILATGPLTSPALAEALAKLLGKDSLSYFDAIAPIVDADSIRWEAVFKQSRFDKGDAESGDQDAYVNCPMDEAQYKAFVAALRDADRVSPHAFEKDVPYFEGCLPIEVMAERGEQTLAFGPMKPIGLRDPKTGRRPYAVVQLRPENDPPTAYNIVGFQTRMTHPAQKRVFGMIPGLENASFLRLGTMHRNTFVDAPRVLSPTLEVIGHPGLYLAGQLTGVEGYVESTACGLLAGLFLARALQGKPVVLPPETTALGGLLSHLRKEQLPFQPSNITWAHVPAPAGFVRKLDRKQHLADRALNDLGAWLSVL